MRTIVAILRFCFFIVEKLTRELALLAALLSSTQGGSLFDRILGGMLDNFVAIYEFGKAYVTDMKFDDFMTEFKAALDEGMAAVSTNVQADSRKVLLGMLLTFVAWKLFAYLLKLIRKNLLKPKKGGGEKEEVKRPERREAGGGRTYQQLYNKDQPPAHTPPRPPNPPEV